jgi:uracil-DNA glycosylase
VADRRVVLVGSNPSVRSPDNSPFHASTRSRIIVDEWFRDIRCQISFINICPEKTPGNKPLTHNQIRNYLPDFLKRLRELNPDRIVALGKTAEYGCRISRLDFISMPHPSGLNRQLNDPKFVADKIEELRKFIDG